jgi:hypothetical protein
MSSNKDKRRFKRYKQKTGCRLSIGGSSFKAHTIDFSIGGIGISVEDSPLLTERAMIDLRIEDPNMEIKGSRILGL